MADAEMASIAASKKALRKSIADALKQLSREEIQDQCQRGFTISTTFTALM